jgi:hypothetical protein
MRVRSVTLLGYYVVGGLGALLILVPGGAVVLTIVGTLLLGASYGPIFPTSVAVTTERFLFAPSRAVSVASRWAASGAWSPLSRVSCWRGRARCHPRAR